MWSSDSPLWVLAVILPMSVPVCIFLFALAKEQQKYEEAAYARMAAERAKRRPVSIRYESEGDEEVVHY